MYENKSHRTKIALAAALAVAILALAGVGYAIANHTYTGTTATQTQTIDEDYVVVELNEAAYTATTAQNTKLHTWWNTNTTAVDTTTYTFVGSDVFKVVVSIDRHASEETIDLVATMAALPADLPSGLILIYSKDSGSTWAAATTSITLLDDDADTETLNVWFAFGAVATAAYNGTDDVVTSANITASTGPAASISLGAITFTATGIQTHT